MAIRPIAAPASEPITVAEAKSHLRVQHFDDDQYIARLISAARAHIEDEIGKAIATQTWRLTLDGFPADGMRLDFGPALSVTKINYDDDAGVERTLSSDQYFLDSAAVPSWVIPTLDGWPATLHAVNSVRVDYVAGWPAGLVPPSLIQATLLLVGDWYENREASSDKPRSKLPHAVDRLIWNHRVFL